MATKSTIFKANLQIADIDHSYYADHALTLARHPSETDERMLVRLAALALNAHLLTDFTDRKRVWIEVGQPEDKPLTRACSKADVVKVYAFGHAADIWWRGIETKLTRLARLEVWRFPSGQAQELATLAERSMQLQATVQEGAITLSSQRGSVHMEPLRWK